MSPISLSSVFPILVIAVFSAFRSADAYAFAHAKPPSQPSPIVTPTPHPTPTPSPTHAPSPTPTPTPTPSPSQGASTPPLPKDSGRIMGIDIYHGNTISSWSAAAASGLKFVAAKATEGTSFEDPQYATFRAGAKAAGLIFGAFHFIHLDEDPVKQADYFASFLEAHGGVDASDFVMLDWETASGDPYSASRDGDTIKAFLNEIKAKLGRRCLVYVDSNMPNAVGNPAFLSEYPLFLANYSGTPAVPAPWKNWNLWQYTDSVSVRGGGSGDGDYFQGSLDDLKALIAYTVLQ